MRQVVLVTVAGIAGVLALSWFLHHRRAEDARARAADDQSKIAAHLSAIVKRDVQGVVLDLRLLDGLDSLRQAAPEAARRDFETFARTRPDYFQVRFIDSTGQERIRLDRDGDAVSHASVLQNKADRYYFKEAMQLAAGEVYVSPLDWNVEFGLVETPMRPTVRFALRSAAGIVVLNADARVLLRAVREASAAYRGRICALDAESRGTLVIAALGDWTFLPPKEATFDASEIAREDVVRLANRRWTIVVASPADTPATQARAGFLEQAALTTLVVILMLASGGLALRYARRSAHLEQAGRHAQELHAANTELHRTRELLVERTRLATLGEMVPTLAHELRNPLQAMLTAARALHDDVRTEDARRLLGILTDEIARLERIVGAVLATNRPAVEEPCDLAELTRHVVELIEAGRGERAVPTIEVRAGERQAVAAPPDTLKQVLWNVLLNACEAAGPAGHVWVQASADGDRAVLEVDDDGPGPGGKPAGEGIGLALCEQLVRQLGGSVQLMPSPRGGARLRIALPLRRAAEVTA